jgi:exopolyphosphatase / guanosine-5'-triphosphate,3'-diphosphate pyrophosphatase
VIRVAAVDLGANATRMLVADVVDGRVEEIARRLVFTRLGEGVDARRRLLPLPIARARNCLTDYRRELEELGAERTLAFGTSALRDAENGEAFLGEIEWSYGFETRLLSGEDEALLTFRGVTAGQGVDPGTLVVDVGGGSTELVLGGPDGVAFHASLDLGCVRLTERFGDDLDACAAHVRSQLPDLEPQHAIGVAGTIAALAVLDLGLVDPDPDRVHGHVLTAQAVQRQVERLAALSAEDRRRVPGLEPERAPVIVAGAVIVREVLARYRLDALDVSWHDILHGAALEAAALPEREEGAAPPGAYTCC